MAIGARRFRRGLPVEQVEVDGYKFLQVQRPGGEPFRLYDFEHLVALELNGQPLEQVAQAVKAKHGLQLTELQIMAFVDRLAELDLLEPEEDAEVYAPEATFEQVAALSAHPVTREENIDYLEEEPTADHGRLALNLMAASKAAKQEESAAVRAPRASAWHEAEPTSLMANMGDLLAVSRAKTGEASVLAPRPPDDDAIEFPSTQQRPSGDLGTREMFSASAQFDAPYGNAPQSPAYAVEAGEREATDAQPAQPPSRLWIWVLLAVGLAAAIGFAAFKFVLRPSAAPVSVDTMLPSPVAAYRWFETAAQLQPANAATLAIPAGGKLIELRDVGAKFATGDTLAATEDSKRIRKETDHLKERVAYYQQLLEAMTAEGNRTEARQAEIKLKEKQQLLEEAAKAYAQVAVVATTSGVVGQHLAKLGDKIPPGAPVLALQGNQLRAAFQLSREEAEQAQRLAFCRLLVNDKPFDCNFVSANDAETVVVELPASVELQPGSAVHLARARFEGVFAIPASAVVQVGSTERLFVAAPTGRAEVRAVALADRTDKEVLVAQGLDMGDAVIVDVPANLVPNALITVNSRVLR